MTRTQRILAVGTILCVIPCAMSQSQSVVDTKHNLSVSGPGAVRAASEQEVCIFCHTPHRASPVAPLWNRRSPLNAYTIYASTALDAKPGQPTGSSKLCLSCHDGTIALGQVLSRTDVIRMAGGITTLPPGQSNLGTDLSDDHPISFAYTSALALRDRQLVDPTQLPEQIHLDANRELQCTACHDAHDDSFGHFLVMSNEHSDLCTSCHRIADTSITPHIQCAACHQQHSAPSGPFLLVGDRVSTTCLTCHGGTNPHAQSLLADLQKFSVHDTHEELNPFFREAAHTSCTDCHDPHTMQPGSASAPNIHPNMGRLSGMSLSGATVESAMFEYEVCFKCHSGGSTGIQATVSRVIAQTDVRLEFEPSAVSYHPVAAPGRGMDVPSLRPGWSTSSLMLCSDCHGSDTSRKAGGAGPNGVHGSNEEPLLLARYETTDFTPESASAYALCYSCHYRDGSDGILSDRSFPHRVHVVDSRATCSTCHDAHGISAVQGTTIGNSHLINFDSTIVFPDRMSGRLEYRSMGTFAGTCTLTCHGVTHMDTSYQQ